MLGRTKQNSLKDPPPPSPADFAQAREGIVVDTPDALLIADRARAQQVGDLVKRLEKSGREDLL